jgi:FHS family Na+ dependent glucose MFS transporter 1
MPDEGNVTATNYAHYDDVTNASETATYSSRIEYPYMIVGVSCFVVALIFFIFYLAMSKTPKMFIPDQQNGVQNIFNPGRCTGGNTRFGLQLLVLIVFFYMFVVGGERAYGKFLFSYALESELQFDKDHAAWLNSVYWICFTAARFISFIVARWVPIHIMLFVQVFGTLASAIGLNIFHNKAVPFWIFSSTLGFFKSPLFPSCLGWANRYMEISAMTIMCVNVGSSAGGMIVQWLTGYLFEYYGPRSFVYILAGYSFMICLIFIIMHIVAKRHGERYSGTNGITRSQAELTTATTGSSQTDEFNMLPVAK